MDILSRILGGLSLESSMYSEDISGFCLFDTNDDIKHEGESSCPMDLEDIPSFGLFDSDDDAKDKVTSPRPLHLKEDSRFDLFNTNNNIKSPKPLKQQTEEWKQ